MKTSFLIILLLCLFCLILNIEIDLKSGESKNFTINSGIHYKFYIKAEYEQILKVYIRCSSKFSEAPKVIYYEYSKRTSKDYLYYWVDENHYYDYVNYSFYYYEYKSISNKTNYMAFEIVPEISLPWIDVYATVSDSISKAIGDFFLTLLLIIILVPVTCSIISISVILIMTFCFPKKKK